MWSIKGWEWRLAILQSYQKHHITHTSWPIEGTPVYTPWVMGNLYFAWGVYTPWPMETNFSVHSMGHGKFVLCIWSVHPMAHGELIFQDPWSVHWCTLYDLWRIDFPRPMETNSSVHSMGHGKFVLSIGSVHPMTHGELISQDPWSVHQCTLHDPWAIYTLDRGCTVHAPWKINFPWPMECTLVLPPWVMGNPYSGRVWYGP